MKKKNLDSFKTILLVFILVILTRMIGTLPWWSFVVPVGILGVVITLKNWDVACFAIGFIAGFIIWLGADIYFDRTLDGNIFNRVAALMSVSKIGVFLISGSIGGILTGLALYTGKSIVFNKTSPLIY